MKAKLVVSSKLDEFNELLDAAITEIERTQQKVDAIEFRMDIEPISGALTYIAFVTSDIRVNNAQMFGQLLPLEPMISGTA